MDTTNDRDAAAATNGALTVASFISTLSAPLTLRGAAEYVTAAALAKVIRNDLKAAVVAGLLPAGCKLSVRKSHGGWSRSLTVEIVAFPGGILSPSYVEWMLDGEQGEFHIGTAMERRNAMHSDAYNAAVDAVTRIADRHNFNNSDYATDYFDVGYYLTVNYYDLDEQARTGVRGERQSQTTDRMAA